MLLIPQVRPVEFCFLACFSSGWTTTACWTTAVSKAMAWSWTTARDRTSLQKQRARLGETVAALGWINVVQSNLYKQISAYECRIVFLSETFWFWFVVKVVTDHVWASSRCVQVNSPHGAQKRRNTSGDMQSLNPSANLLMAINESALMCRFIGELP